MRKVLGFQNIRKLSLLECPTWWAWDRYMTEKYWSSATTEKAKRTANIPLLFACAGVVDPRGFSPNMSFPVLEVQIWNYTGVISLWVGIGITVYREYFPLLSSSSVKLGIQELLRVLPEELFQDRIHEAKHWKEQSSQLWGLQRQNSDRKYNLRWTWPFKLIHRSPQAGIGA